MKPNAPLELLGTAPLAARSFALVPLAMLPACTLAGPWLFGLAPLQAPVAAQAEATAPAPLVPGQVPAGTDQRARAAWEALVAAALPTPTAGMDARPVTSFDLEFDGRFYGEGRQTNDFSGRYRYLEPGYVHTVLDRSQRVTLRGPEGDFLEFHEGPQKGTAIPLVGRDYELDVEDLDRAIGVAQSFVALTDPRTIRIARMALLSEAPSSIPDRLRERARALEWLSVDTPDFRLESDPEPDPIEGFGDEPSAGPGGRRAAPTEVMHRLELGLDPSTRLPSLVVVRAAELGQAGFESAQLLQLDQFRPMDGYRVPHAIVTYGPDASTSPWTFDLRRPSFELYVERGTLRPALDNAFFTPRKR